MQSPWRAPLAREVALGIIGGLVHRVPVRAGGELITTCAHETEFRRVCSCGIKNVLVENATKNIYRIRVAGLNSKTQTTLHQYEFLGCARRENSVVLNGVHERSFVNLFKFLHLIDRPSQLRVLFNLLGESGPAITQQFLFLSLIPDDFCIEIWNWISPWKGHQDTALTGRLERGGSPAIVDHYLQVAERETGFLDGTTSG